MDEGIDKGAPCAYFDGASQGEPHSYGGGGLIHFVESHWIKFGACLGEVTNNYAELMAIKLVLLQKRD